jgi:hypothetical protein
MSVFLNHESAILNNIGEEIYRICETRGVQYQKGRETL